MSYIVQYRPNTGLGQRYPLTKYPWKGPGFTTREEAAALMRACPNVEFMEVVEVGVSPVETGQTAVADETMEVHHKGRTPECANTQAGPWPELSRSSG